MSAYSVGKPWHHLSLSQRRLHGKRYTPVNAINVIGRTTGANIPPPSQPDLTSDDASVAACAYQWFTRRFLAQPSKASANDSIA